MDREPQRPDPQPANLPLFFSDANPPKMPTNEEGNQSEESNR